MKKYYFLLILISFFSVGLFFYKMNVSPPALNADEAANGYDAYSILTTGKDQYGNFMPLRFRSFGDYKLPLLTYLAIPFIKIFGLTETGIRMVNLPFVFLFPIAVFLLAEELFKKKGVSLLAAFLSAFAPGLQLLGRQAHEGFLTAFFLTLLTYLFLRLIKKSSAANYCLFFVTLLVSLFGYHFSRLWAGFYFLLFLFFAFKKKLAKSSLLVFILVVSLFIITDVIYKPSRIKDLLFFNNIGFSLKINELRAEGGSRFLYNKLTVGAKDLTQEYLKYFSPQFLVINGDENPRFGFSGVSPITTIEYLFIFIGFYYLFKNKEKWRYLILLILLFSPVSASLSWAGQSITRSIFIFIPTLIISAYGIINFLNKKHPVVILLLVIGYLTFNFYSWDFYLNHYPKRAVVLRSWQAGYKELSNYVKTNYDRFDQFYITHKNGQPYIFLLFYLNYPPGLYQKQASLSPPDEYGFGQVEKFDKFKFFVNPIDADKNVVVVGYPDDFSGDMSAAEKQSIKIIKVGTEEMFWIKEIEALP